jgi:hypothetical protein
VPSDVRFVPKPAVSRRSKNCGLFDHPDRANEPNFGTLVPVLTEFLPEQYSIEALYPHREHLPAKVRSFIDLVAKNLRSATWQAGEKAEC